MLTFLNVLRWLAGIFVLMAAGGAFLSGSLVGGAIVLLAGLILLPPTGRRLGFLLPTSLKGDGEAVNRALLSLPVGLVLCIVGVLWSVIQEDAEGLSTPIAKTAPRAPSPNDAVTPLPAPRAEPREKPAPAPPKAVTVDPGVLGLIEGAGWDKTRREWGRAGVAKVNRLMPAAAARVAASPECDSVIAVGLSSDRGRAPNDPVFFIDCNNKRRFYVSEADLAKEEPAVSRNAQVAGVSDSGAIATCERSVRQQLNLPSSYDRDLLNTRVLRSEYGTVNVQFTFQAKNRLGVEANLRATCFVDDRGVHPAEIEEL